MLDIKKAFIVLLVVACSISFLVPRLSADEDGEDCKEIQELKKELRDVKKELNNVDKLNDQMIRDLYRAARELREGFNELLSEKGLNRNVKRSAKEGLRGVEFLEKSLKEKHKAKVIASLERLYKIISHINDYAECDD